MPTFHHTVPDDPPRERVDAYATRVFVALASRAQAKKAIKAERLLVDMAPCRSAWFVRPGNRLTLMLPETASQPVLQLKLTLPYVDDHLAVVYKPAGIHVRGNHARTVHRAMRHNLPISPLSDALPDPDPVHRLDFRTSGLLLVARTASARVGLARAFQERRIFKRYRAVVLGALSGSGEIDTPLDGRESLSRYAAVRTVPSLRTDWLTEVDLLPVTGRTHQLRRHITELGHPILGDDLYFKGPILRGVGLFLSAVEQRFAHPITGEEVHVVVDPPAKFDTHLRREARRFRRWRGEE